LPTVSGTGAVANALVHVLVGGVTVGSVTASAAGAWTYAFTSTLSAGTNAITAVGEDVAGNDGPASAALNVVVDTSAATLNAPDLAAGSDTGSSNTDDITSNATPTVGGGGAEANATIYVLSGGVTIGSTTATGAGNWSFTFTSTLSAGTHAISVVHSDTAGNTSTSSALNITVDTTAPTTQDVPDLLAASDLGVSSTDNITSSPTQQLSGSAGTGDTVSILVGGTTLQTVTAAGGSWSYTATLSAGSYAITVSETDVAGNESAASSALNMVVNEEPTSDGGGGGGSGGGTTSTTTTNTSTAPSTTAIVQNTGNNGNLVTASVPASVTISSSGPATAQSGDTAVTTLINAINNQSPTGATVVVGNAQTFLNSLAATTQLDIRTIVPTVGTGVTTDDPIIITGSTGGSQSEAFVIDMRGVTGKILQLDNIEFASIIGNATVTGGSGNNYATGDGSDQFISLGEGDDTLYGGDGNDTIGSASGNDRLFGEGGNDTVIGGTGNDSLWGGTDTDVVYGNQDADILYGNQANDTLYGGQDADVAYGGQDADVAYGNLADDVLYGNLGADTLYGGQGNDVLFGGQGNDLLQGNLGDDWLHGNLGDDTITTGSGADTVAVASSGGADVVTDFDGASGDRIQIASDINGSGIDTYAELLAAATDTDDGVQIALGSGNTLTLNGVTVSQLQSGWFTFG
jgi:Ca2+-binding RTX toxin-like protein